MMIAALNKSGELFVQLVQTYCNQVWDGEFIALPDVSAVKAKQLAQFAFNKADQDKSGSIDFVEFVEWATLDPVFSQLMAMDSQLFGALPPLGVPAGALDAFQQTTQFRRMPIEELYTRYESLDTDDNDKIGVEGVLALVQDMFGAYAIEIATSVHQMLNSDGSGRVEPAKVVCALNILTSGKEGDKARVFFRAFDEDNSESLSKAEFVEMMVAALWQSAQLVFQLVQQYCGGVWDGDFVALPDVGVVRARQLATAAFKVADADGSGAIDFAEFAAWAKTRSALLAAHQRRPGRCLAPRRRLACRPAPSTRSRRTCSSAACRSTSSTTAT
jgi:Ca2+-binding EF-hand superfamily protein